MACVSKCINFSSPVHGHHKPLWAYCAWRRRVQHEVGTHHCDVYESYTGSDWMGRFDHGGMACITPFKGTYRLLWECGARKARLALEREVVVVLAVLLVPHQIRYTYTYSTGASCVRSRDLRLMDRMAYCHGYPSLASFFEESGCCVGSRAGAKMPHVSQAITA